MSNVTYSAGNLTITVAGLDTVEQALGDLKRKTPAAAKVAINATARQTRKLMVAKAMTGWTARHGRSRPRTARTLPRINTKPTYGRKGRT